MSLGCARCGDCCEQIWISASPEALVDALEADLARPQPLGPQPGLENTAFIVAHWDPTGQNRRGTKFQYSCRRFDPESRQCTAYDDRPPVCQHHPWYSKTVEETAATPEALHPRCSFWLDVDPGLRPEGARPLIPLTVA